MEPPAPSRPETTPADSSARTSQTHPDSTDSAASSQSPRSYQINQSGKRCRTCADSRIIGHIRTRLVVAQLIPKPYADEAQSAPTHELPIHLRDSSRHSMTSEIMIDSL